MVKSADRVLQLLELLAKEADGLTHAEIANRLSIPKSSLTGLMTELSSSGYVEHDRERRRFLLGPRVVGLARSYLGRIDIVRIAQPLLAAIAAELGNSCALTVRSDDDMLVVCKQDVVQTLQHSMQLGERGPVYASASGKAVLAAAGPDAVEAYLGRTSLAALTSYTLTDVEALRVELDEVARSGIGYSRRELVDGIIAIGIAVLDADGAPVAGLSVSVPETIFNPTHEARVIESLRQSQVRLAALLGADSPPLTK